MYKTPEPHNTHVIHQPFTVVISQYTDNNDIQHWKYTDNNNIRHWKYTDNNNIKHWIYTDNNNIRHWKYTDKQLHTALEIYGQQ